MLKGMATTARHLFMPTFNAGYPGIPKVLPERSRSSFVLPLDDDGLPLCKSCQLCAKSCPDSAIIIESEKAADGPGRVLTRFTIDLGLCMYCGICVEMCTASGLAHAGEFENATHLREETLLVLFDRARDAKGATPATGDSPVGGEGPS